MQRTKQNHAWRVFRLLLIFFCIGLSLQFTSCGKKQAENTVFSVDDLSGKKIGVQLGTTGDTLVSDYETDGSNTTVAQVYSVYELSLDYSTLHISSANISPA